MIAKRRTIRPAWVDPDDAPDTSTPEWRAKFDSAPVMRGGRPKLANPKQQTTIRLDADVMHHFRAGGPGWQSRINQALREWVKAR
jgi:uncharacterized protein (DUF4415 family)